MNHRIVVIGLGILSIIGVSFGWYAGHQKLFPSKVLGSTTLPEVTWQLKAGNIWQPTGTPPPCPQPLLLGTPVDISKVTAILYPGQPRGNAWKPHGAFRFDQKSSNITIKVPFDAKVVRGAHLVINGENQYGFEFIAPCGISYSFGHMRILSPKFQTIADKLPVIQNFAKQQFFDITPPLAVKQGEVIATAVGYAKTKNIMVDWGMLDLRHKNGVTLRSAWAAKYANEFDAYAVCWLDFLPPKDAKYLRGLFGSGDAETGTRSDYCHYPENK